jgi:hypothetical protein
MEILDCHQLGTIMATFLAQKRQSKPTSSMILLVRLLMMGMVINFYMGIKIELAQQPLCVHLSTNPLTTLVSLYGQKYRAIMEIQ